MNIFPVKPVNPVHKFFLCGLATLREDHNPVNLVNRVKNSGLYVDAIAGQTTLYYNDPEWRVLAEYNGTGTLQGTIVWGNYIDEALVLDDPNGNDGSFWIRRLRGNGNNGIVRANYSESDSPVSS